MKRVIGEVKLGFSIWLSRYWQTISFPLILLLVAMLAFGILIPWLGLYMDDWSILWLAQQKGDLTPFFQHNRPWLIPVYSFLGILLPAKPWIWQVLLFGLKYLGALAVWVLARKYFVKENYIPAAISIVYMLHPTHAVFFHPLGFFFQCLQAVLFLGSLIMHLKVLEKESEGLLFFLLAFALAAVNLVILEYFFFLELARPLLVFLFIHSRQPKSILKETWKRSIQTSRPFLLLFVAAVVWKTQTVHLLQRYSLAGFTEALAEPVHFVLSFAGRFFQDMWQATNSAILYAVYPKDVLRYAYAGEMVWVILIIGVVAGIVFFSLRKLEKEKHLNSIQRSKCALTLFLYGCALLLLAFIPFWMVGLKFIIGFDVASRYLLPSALGASLVIVGCITLLSFRKNVATILLAILAGFLAGAQFLSMNAYRHEWEEMKTKVWQIGYRIPALPPKTLVLSNEMPLRMMSENSLSAILNWMYSENREKGSSDYYWYFDQQRFEREVGFVQEAEMHSADHMIGHFEGRSSDVLVLHFPANGCMHLLQPEKEILNFGAPQALSEIVNFSTFDHSKLLDDDNQNPLVILDKVFANSFNNHWCFYYQKAMVAIQRDDWQTAGAIFEEALSEGHFPFDMSEWMALLQAFALGGKEDLALKWTELLYQANADLRSPLCAVWLDINRDTAMQAERPTIAAAMLLDLACSAEK